MSITEGHLSLPPINTFSRAQLGYTGIQVLTKQEKPYRLQQAFSRDETLNT